MARVAVLLLRLAPTRGSPNPKNFGSIRNSLDHRRHQLLRGFALIHTQFVLDSLSPFRRLAASALLPFTVRHQTKQCVSLRQVGWDAFALLVFESKGQHGTFVSS